jgi:predicted metalloprotease
MTAILSPDAPADLAYADVQLLLDDDIMPQPGDTVRVERVGCDAFREVYSFEGTVVAVDGDAALVRYRDPFSHMMREWRYGVDEMTVVLRAMKEGAA